MNITCDPKKNLRNIKERGLPFDLVAELDWDTAIAREDVRRDYGERRMQVLGYLGLRLHVAVVTYRGDAEPMISFRKASKKRLSGMTRNDDDRAAMPDAENPEWTREQVRDARPALDVFKDLFGPEAAEVVKRGRGRPVKADRKVNQTLRLDVDVLDAYRRIGPGWQALMNRTLRDHMPGSAE